MSLKKAKREKEKLEAEILGIESEMKNLEIKKSALQQTLEAYENQIKMFRELGEED